MFISYAYAADAVPTDLMSFLPFIIIFVLFYFMLIRPQMKQAKAHKLMIDSLKKDDEIVTNGGLLGKVVKIKDQYRNCSEHSNSYPKAICHHLAA
jgi:preprotein translocase subunit YajC